MDLVSEIGRLRIINDELVAALKEVDEIINGDYALDDDVLTALSAKIRPLIAKAEAA